MSKETKEQRMKRQVECGCMCHDFGGGPFHPSQHCRCTGGDGYDDLSGTSLPPGDNFANVGDRLTLRIESEHEVTGVVSNGVTWTRLDDHWEGYATQAGKVEPTVIASGTSLPETAELTNTTDLPRSEFVATTDTNPVLIAVEQMGADHYHEISYPRGCYDPDCKFKSEVTRPRPVAAPVTQWTRESIDAVIGQLFPYSKPVFGDKRRGAIRLRDALLATQGETQ